MSLPHVILTVLSTREASGYDITKEFSNNLGYSWNASHQQVYRELNKLAKKDMVTCLYVPQEGKPDRKVYSITELGRESLAEWFQQPATSSTVRDELAAKLLACGVHHSGALQLNTEAMLKEQQELLNQQRELEQAQYANQNALSRQDRLDRLALRRVIHNTQAKISWIQEILSELKELDAPRSTNMVTQ